MHIAVAGNIGAGKTTLTRLLAKHYKWEPHFEDVVDNPYLDDFYHQMERWSFNLQIYFLNSRFRQVLQIRQSGKNTTDPKKIIPYPRKIRLHQIKQSKPPRRPRFSISNQMDHHQQRRTHESPRHFLSMDPPRRHKRQ